MRSVASSNSVKGAPKKAVIEGEEGGCWLFRLSIGVLLLSFCPDLKGVVLLSKETSLGCGVGLAVDDPNIRSSGCLLQPMDIRSSRCRGGGIHTSFVEVCPATTGGIGPSHSSFTTTNQLLISASVELFWLIIAQQS